MQGQVSISLIGILHVISRNILSTLDDLTHWVFSHDKLLFNHFFLYFAGDQPISGFDWSHDKTGLGVCTGFDQKIRLVICTKLNTL